MDSQAQYSIVAREAGKLLREGLIRSALMPVCRCVGMAPVFHSTIIAGLHCNLIIRNVGRRFKSYALHRQPVSSAILIAQALMLIR